jgi:chorismate lyase/3-hydroxybenzoate synthase
MSLSPTSDMDFTRGMLREALPAPRMTFIDAPANGATLDALLAEADVLAVFGFGAAAPAWREDSRYLRVALEPFARAPYEVWRVAGPVETSTRGVLRWATDGDFAFAALELDETVHGGLAGAAQEGYLQLTRWLGAHGMHALRIWNHIDAINLGVGDEERYRQFCSGRAAGMRAGFTHGYPAATAIGVRDSRRVLQVYCLAARRAGAPVENPRQMNAWRYPREYGPDAPCFARALRAPTHSAQVYISGTAAIVGHTSRHNDDFAAQLGETLANIDSVLDAAQVDKTDRYAQCLMKAYVRRDEDFAAAMQGLKAAHPLVAPLLLCGDICRSELLVEIDGVQGA